MLQVTVSGNTREELIANLASWIDLLSGQRVGDQQLKTEEPIETKKRGRPAKAAVTPEPLTMALPMEVQVPPVTPAEQAAHEAREKQAAQSAKAPLTLQDAVNALKGVAAIRPGDTGPTDGYQRVSKILVEYGYKNVKEIKPEHFEAVIADCQGGV